MEAGPGRRLAGKNGEKKRKQKEDRRRLVADIEDFAGEESQEIRASLLRWYDENHRALPWRSPPSAVGVAAAEDEEERAYAVWVSEVMLQQTQVPTVVAYFNRWMERWPTIHSLALASQEEVNDMWAGLGYYRRARYLLEGAKAIVQNGGFPRTAVALRGVRGIGDYTAGAIASIAFNEAVPVVDGNVVRVISRLKAISANPKESATVKGYWMLAGQLVDPRRPGDFNQSIMELGATLCSVKNPSCSICPVSDQCRAFLLARNNESAKVTDYPSVVTRVKKRDDFAAVCVVEIVGHKAQEVFPDGRDTSVYLLTRRPDKGLLAGLWEFPSILMEGEVTNQNGRRRMMDEYIKKSLDLDVKCDCQVITREDVGEYVHVFTHIRLRMYVEWMVLAVEGGLNLPGNKDDPGIATSKCVDCHSIKSLGLTSGVRKVYNMVRDFKEKQSHKQASSPQKKKLKKRTL